MGVGEASGMFPIGDGTLDYDKKMMASFDELISDKGFSWKLADILPKVLNAGDDAGTLTAEGAAYLDPEGDLEAGIPMCPPEGDAGTEWLRPIRSKSGPATYPQVLPSSQW
jgi:sugar (pentulose or hexulose) kinase